VAIQGIGVFETLNGELAKLVLAKLKKGG